MATHCRDALVVHVHYDLRTENRQSLISLVETDVSAADGILRYLSYLQLAPGAFATGSVSCQLALAIVHADYSTVLTQESKGARFRRV
jgi:hypothetical protein